MIRLHMSEMPWLPPEHVLTNAAKGLRSLNRYADQEDLRNLKNLLSQYTGVPSKHIILSPGSDILLRDLILAFGSNRKLVTLSPSFLPTSQAAVRFSPKIVRIRLLPPKFNLKPEPLIEELDEPTLLILENPNNPTGKLILDQETLENVLTTPKTLTIIDEAYFEFSGVSFAPLVSRYPNLALTRSLDKAFGLAGARVGYALAGEQFLEALSTFSSLLPRPSLLAAEAALAESQYKDRYIGKVLEERERLRTCLSEMEMSVYPSNTNFILMKTPFPDIADVLKKQDILVADMASQLAPGFIRVSVGTPEENNAFIDAMKSLLRGSLKI